MSRILVVILFFLICCKKEFQYLKEMFWIKSSDSKLKTINDSLQVNFQKGIIKKNPLIVINGEIYNNDSKSDTVTLPFNQNAIHTFDFLRREISVKINNELGEME
ncbi:hypothetical protein [Moheibacter lacus]|uniref:Uncharacterized protein n=1 Tax=Moheibacter lacus TaxID=2745851 RepID=A0A838ZTI1_9FLAO|nr:hypothetical protein [Moheibacter lacus]MBA5630287.1 hypothetical protein [Moheibacter lacus]